MKSKFLFALSLCTGLFSVAFVSAESNLAPSQEDLQIFNEGTSFEELLAKKEEASRAPAALEPLARVIAVKRELGLTNAAAARAQQDIVLNGGTNSGFSKGLIISVFRKIPVIDPYRENAQSELEVEFARIKIVHVQKEISIGRIEELEPIDTGLALGARGIMVGDFVSRSGQ